MDSGAEERFGAYVDGLVSVIGHADRAKPLRDYCAGLLLPGERKSVERLAARTAPERTAAQHQSLLHFVGQGGWSDEKVLAKVQEMVLPRLERRGPVEAWIIDDTGFPKKGTHSVGGLGNIAASSASRTIVRRRFRCRWPTPMRAWSPGFDPGIAYRLYLPQAWASDAARRKKAGVPEGIAFKTKP